MFIVTEYAALKIIASLTHVMLKYLLYYTHSYYLSCLPKILQLKHAFEPVHEVFNKFDILTSVDSDEPLQPPFNLRNAKWCSVSSLTIVEYSSD